MKAGDIQSFYERMPYPAPRTSFGDRLASLKSPERKRAHSLLMFPGGEPRKRQNILVAGCGTSQAANIALREPDAAVTAIDISSTSLGYQRALQRKYELDNLELRQMSILDIASLGRTFDQIICTGVLHHLPDPDQGLRALRDVLDQDGAMQIMVYGAYGRTGVYMMQEYCRLLGIKPTDRELATLGAAVKQLPGDHPIAPLLHKFKDFGHPDALADALLHPQDRAYTVPQIQEWLEGCGMVFGRWYEQAPYLPQCGAVGGTAHAGRLARLSEADQHAAVELFRGTITNHSFVAYRSDRETATQPVQFTGRAWRDYVPVRIPWTRILRERLPPGAVAVLLNPVHKHTDLFVPIDAAEERLLDLMDGKRTLGEIDASIPKKRDADFTPRFVKKLWDHDLIVIDARAGARQALDEDDRAPKRENEAVA